MILKVFLLPMFFLEEMERDSVQFSRSVMSDSLQPHELQHATPPCPSPAPGVYPNPCPSSWYCHPTISSSVVPFSSCPQSFPASGSFQMSELFTSGINSMLNFVRIHEWDHLVLDFSLLGGFWLIQFPY